jgi:hypothetical protein
MTETVIAIGLSIGLALFLFFQRGREFRLKEEADRAPPEESSTPGLASFRVEDLGRYLDNGKLEAETEKHAEKDRLQRLQDLWAGVAPLVTEAIKDGECRA